MGIQVPSPGDYPRGPPSRIVPESTIAFRIALAGTGSFIGAALVEALDPSLDIRILTRSMARHAPREGIEVRPCDHFSRKELREALEGVDAAVYLVHNRDPSARLDQAQTQDMDLLVADNFAWAAARNGVKQILCRSVLMVRPDRPTARRAREMEEVLAGHGVPLTVLRTGLVLGPGGEFTKLLAHVVRRLPLIPLPAHAESPVYPLTLQAFLAAVRHCVGHPESYGGTFDVFGPEAVTLKGLLEDTAALLGRRARFLRWRNLPEGPFWTLMQALGPRLHPDFLVYLMDLFSAGERGTENPVQQAVVAQWVPFRQTLEAAVRAQRSGSPGTTRHLDDDRLREMGRVRSIQRMHLPEGRNAQWMADRYFAWLGTLMKAFIVAVRDPDGSWTIRQRPWGPRLLRLDFQPSHSTPDRRMYFITGGFLSGTLGRREARLEFRDLLHGRFTLVAIHDFDPALPWMVYRFTQAAMHGLVMKAFQGYMEQAAEGQQGF
ncbi:MAG: NAD(P)H-binding protein [Acidobacteria bacterium]|nr:NAD(P)H-binding protein [Acidobacteriota bacterium]